METSNQPTPRASRNGWLALLLASAVALLAAYVPLLLILAPALKTSNYLEIVDDLVYASGQPDGFVDAVSTALQAVARLGAGHAEIVDGDVKIAGSAWYPSAAEELVSATEEALPKLKPAWPWKPW